MRRLAVPVLAAAALGLVLLLVRPDDPAPAVRTTTPSAVTVMAVGDIACPPGAQTTPRTCQHQQVAAVVRAADPDFLIPLGDLQYEAATYGEFLAPGAYDDTLGALKDRTLPVLGNHEYLDPAGVAAGYFDYFGGADTLGAPPKDGAPGGYYTREIGEWRFIALNSECGPDASNRNIAAPGGCAPGSSQYRWLQATLESNKARCTLVAFHRPRWTTGAHLPYAAMGPMWDLMARSGVDVAIAGHNHSSEVFRPIGVSGAGMTPVLDPKGIRSFVAGAGGKDLYPFKDVQGPLSHVSEARDSTTFGPLQLTLRSRSFDWAYVPIEGQTFTNVGTSGTFSGKGERCH